MKVLFFFIIILPSFVFAETYSCKYEELNQIKYINFDRITHSHFTRCTQDECNKKKYSVIFANNDSLIIGDMEKNKKSYFLFIIDKNTNSFSAANIKSPSFSLSSSSIKTTILPAAISLMSSCMLFNSIFNNLVLTST